MLFGVFNFILEIGDLGKAHYNMWAVMVYTIALIPSYLYLLIPLAVLIGVMTAMLSMVNYSEYVIFRTSGMSLRRITFLLVLFGIFCALITFGLGEMVSPQTNHFAQIYKLSKTNEIMSNALQSGLWTKDGDHTFVNIKNINPNNQLSGVNIFNYEPDLTLKEFIHSVNADYDKKNQRWILHNVVIKSYAAQDIKIIQQNNYLWHSSIRPEFFNILVTAPEDMSIFTLTKFITHLKVNNQSIQRYNIALWNKLLYPISCLSMTLIALGFIPNNRRNINLGTKLFVGIMIGIAFFFITRFIGFMALLFSWNPIIATTTPTLSLFIIAWCFILHQK